MDEQIQPQQATNQEFQPSPPQGEPFQSHPVSPTGGQPNKKIWIFILVGLIIAGGAFGFYVWQKGELFPALPTPAVSPTPPSDPTTDWQTYRNEEYGFEVRYPKNWELMNYTIGPDPVFELSGDEGVFLVLPKGAEIPPLRPIGTSPDGESFYTQEGKLFMYRKKFDSVPSSWESYGSVYAQAKIENIKEYQPEGLTIPISADVNQNDVEIIDQILSTFRFLEPTVSSPTITSTPDPTAGWLAHRNNQYGFETRYPNDWKLELSGTSTIFKSPDYTINDPLLGESSSLKSGAKINVFRWQNAGNYNLEQLLSDYSIQSNKISFAIGSRQAVSIDTIGEFGVYKTVALTIKDSFVYQIEYIYPDGQKTKYNPTFNQILSTFRFLE